MPGVKTNERIGTRAVLRHCRMSAYKARQVLDLIRGQDADRAAEILALGDREAATVIGKVLASAVANAVHNDGFDAEELFVSACYADEGSTLKRWRPRARGRATRIRKRTCHITIIVSRLPQDRIVRRRAKQAAAGAQRSRRVAGSRRSRRTEPGDAVESTKSKVSVTEVDEVLTGIDSGEPIDVDADDADDVVEVDDVTAGSDVTTGSDVEIEDASTDVNGSDEVDETNGDAAEEKGK